MPSDYGDEAGEKLFDYLLRFGQDAGKYAMAETANRLSEAFRKARTGISSPVDYRTDEAVSSEAPQWAKLNLKDFADLPQYDSIKEVIDASLDKAGIDHDFYSDKDRTEFLLFKVDDAPDVNDVFESLEHSTQKACEEVMKVRGVTREQIRDMEPLSKKVEAARAASKAVNDREAREIVRNRIETRSL
ncbi:hypothetical protein [Ellagibacter isourolithinifaciens]|uniref:hypothetical protein n=1 Tax=Ellagibacter isourolithinifaciens TaxID=2137581 RepID=UPI0023EFEC4C|nr:hypothetical protein [Ellagibacter isourolithinifaciens]MDD5925522.1 hypothetical protein [Ellagibacter isourolithinifaciens]